jgi:hypothetical protein
MMVDISNFTAAKILDERPSPSGVKYRFDLKPLWLTTDLVEKGEDGTRSHPELQELSHRQAAWGR